MNNFKQAWKEQFGCAKSKIKVHNFAYVVSADSRYTVKEVCLKCLKPRY